MAERPDSLLTLGLESDGNTIRAARLSLKKNRPYIEELFEHPKNDIFTASLLRTNDQSLILTALHTPEVLVRGIEVKLKKEKDVDAVLAFQTEPLLPYPLENGVIDRMIVGPSQEGMLLTVFAARKDHVQQHLAFWNHFQIEPEVVTCVPAALTAYAHHFYPSEEPVFVIHIGHTTTTCALVQQGKLLGALSSQNGIAKLLEADPEALEADYMNLLEKPGLEAAKESLRLDTIRLIYALSKQLKGKEATALIAAGDGAVLKNLATSILQGLNKNLITIEHDDNYGGSDFLRYAIPIGNALSGLPKQDALINFRQEEFDYPNPWKRYKKTLLAYFSLIIALSAALYFFGQSYIASKEDSLKRSYSELLFSMQKPYTAFESEFLKKHPSQQRLEEGQQQPLLELSQDDILSRLKYLEKEIQTTPDSFPLLPSIPRVSDVLAWLSQHPALQSQDKEALPVQIDNFNYTLVKRPDLTKKQEKYQVKVDLEFSSPTPKQAREFHDALIAPNDFVDPKGEIKWSSNRGKYRTSFFLKDRTVYPNNSN